MPINEHVSLCDLAFTDVYHSIDSAILSAVNTHTPCKKYRIKENSRPWLYKEISLFLTLLCLNTCFTKWG